MANLNFPDGFIWGTATAAHQVEGGNWNSDWWEWETREGTVCAEPSNDACDQWHRYGQDIAMLAGFGFNAYRFSVEWARVEPEEGLFSRATLDHYRRVAATCHEHGLTPIVTYHHFTSPRWVAADGSWENPRTAERFARYCEKVTAHLGDLVGVACTINEPNVVAFYGYRHPVFPPGKSDADSWHRANEVFLDAHARAVEAIKGGPGAFPVGMTLSMNEWEAVDGGEARLERMRQPYEDQFLEAARADDFIGVQAYTRERVGPDGQLPPPEGAETTLMGYEFRPEALAATVRRAWEVTDGTPVIVTENGTAMADDTRRIAYVEGALEGLHQCLADGIDLRGYCYWTLLDNFEWVFGYMPTFGLVAVDRETYERTPKPSASWLGAVARANALET
ncbi:MAG TPA: family 1 glycosylhydrolase [Acidimicrobiia bacterium]|nr:family 1 glycosylhydrolase [Acidimicrobiia bacterium]